MIFIPIPLPGKVYELPAVLFVIQSCSTNCLGHGNGYECSRLRANGERRQTRSGLGMENIVITMMRITRIRIIIIIIITM